MPSVKRDNSRSSIASITDENEGLIRRTNLQGKTQPSNETVLAAPTTSEPSIEEVKNRMGAALHRIKNRVEELQSVLSHMKKHEEHILFLARRLNRQTQSISGLF